MADQPPTAARRVDPTALQAARLHIGQIRATWPMLEDARTTRITRPHLALSGRAAASRDEDLRAERADRDAAIAYRALAASPAPLALAVLDAENEAITLLADLTWRIRSDLRQWSTVLETPPTDVDGRLTWLTTHLADTTPELVATAAGELRTAARAVMAAAGHQDADDWRPSGKRCPVCGQRSIQVWDLSHNRLEHTRECTGQHDDGKPCRCTGTDCPCERPGARPGSRHLWPA